MGAGAGGLVPAPGKDRREVTPPSRFGFRAWNSQKRPEMSAHTHVCAVCRIQSPFSVRLCYLYPQRSALSASEGFVRLLIFLALWFLLLVVSWPLALLILLLAPVVYLVALFALLRAVLLCPARVLGYRA
jgi:hypothetical protein